MEVLDASDAVLSNYEVLAFLREQKARLASSKKHQGLGQLATLTLETVASLETGACAQQSPELVRDFLAQMEPFRLSQAEKLMLLNLGAASAVEVHLLVEESEERLTEEQVEQIVDIVQKMFRTGEEEEEGEGGNDNGETEADDAEAGGDAADQE